MKKIPFEYKITFAYIIIGALWILFSDELVYFFTKDPELYFKISKYKGWFYVLVTGILLYMLIKKEIQRRNIIYDQLLEAKKKADEIDLLKTAFLSNLSHYIRTPMNSILGFIELLESKDTSPEKQKQFLTYINERSENLLQTLNSIIEISKIQEGFYKIEKTEFSLKELLVQITTTFKFEAAQKNICITKSYTEEIDIQLFSDKKILSQILTQLLSNAIHFSLKGEVELQYKIIENQVVLYIKDSGPGISEHAKKSLFNDFMHNTGQTYVLGEGAGIGLYLSNQLAKLIDCKLFLEQSGSSGSTFGISIPIK